MRPGNFTRAEAHLVERLRHHGIVAIVDDGFGTAKERQFLLAFFLQRREPLLMRFSHVGENPHRRLHDGFELFHLAALRDAHLDDSQLGLLVDFPHRERHSYLRVVAPWRTHHGIVVAQQLVEPLFHHRLAVTAGNAYDGNPETPPMGGRQGLQGLQRIGDEQEVGLGHRLFVVGTMADDKIPDTLAVKVANVTMTVVAVGNQGKEEGLFGESERAAVGEQRRNDAGFSKGKIGSNDFSDFGYIIFHRSLMLRAVAARQTALRRLQRKHIFRGNFRV